MFTRIGHYTPVIKCRLLLSLVVTMLCLLAPGESAQGRTWYIKADGSGDAPTIQAGIDSATAGDVVLVGPGTFQDTVHVDLQGSVKAVNAYVTKEISLRSEKGADETRIDGVNSDIGVLLVGVGNAAEVRGFEFTFVPLPGGGCITSNSQVGRSSQRLISAPMGKVAIWCQSSSCVIAENFIHDAEADTGIHLDNSAPTITSNAITTVVHGVSAESGSNATISQNIFTDCAVAITTVDSSPVVDANAIRLVNAYACRGIECVGTGGGGGVPTPVITNNVIELIEIEAIWCVSVAPTIIGNTIRRTAGISVNSCGETICNGNTLIENVRGIRMQATPMASIEGNTLDANITGMQIYNGSNPNVTRNIIYRGSIGVECFFLVAPVFSCNDVFGTTASLYSGDCLDQTGLNGNFSADPQFCGTDGSGNYYLQADSPCASGNHPQSVDCGTVGAFAPQCSTVPVKTMSWGRAKSVYR